MGSGNDRLDRRLGMGDALVIGLGSMIGAGVFAAVGPAAQAAGPALLLGLAVAAVVAYCNAMSSAWLAARLQGYRARRSGRNQRAVAGAARMRPGRSDRAGIG